MLDGNIRRTRPVFGGNRRNFHRLFCSCTVLQISSISWWSESSRGRGRVGFRGCTDTSWLLLTHDLVKRLECIPWSPQWCPRWAWLKILGAYMRCKNTPDQSCSLRLCWNREHHKDPTQPDRQERQSSSNPCFMQIGLSCIGIFSQSSVLSPICIPLSNFHLKLQLESDNHTFPLRASWEPNVLLRCTLR